MTKANATVVKAIRVIPSYDRFTASLVRASDLPDSAGAEGATEAEAIARLRSMYDRLPADLPVLRVATDGTPRA